jgi:hypothetical protein
MVLADLFPAAAGLLYLGAAAAYGLGGQRGMAFAYLAYALANVGLILAAIEGRK